MKLFKQILYTVGLIMVDDDGSSFSRMIIGFVGFVTGLLVAIISLFPDEWLITPVLKFYVGLFVSVIALLIIIGVGFHTDYNRYKKLKSEISSYYDIMPQFILTKYEKWVFELEKDGDVRLTRSVEIKNISERVIHEYPICMIHDIIPEKYLFSWEKVPGNDSGRLIEFLMQNFNIEWIKAAKINKIDDGKTIMITNNTNFLSLTLNNEQNNVNIEIDDGRTDKFIVKTENGELNIYPEKNENEFNPVIKMVEVDSEKIPATEFWHKVNGALHKPNGEIEGEGWTIIRLNLKPNEASIIKIEHEQRGIFSKMYEQERAGSYITTPTDFLQIIVKPPDGKDIYPIENIPEIAIVENKALGFPDFSEKERINPPVFRNKQAKWTIEKPKIGNFYWMNFKIK